MLQMLARILVPALIPILLGVLLSNVGKNNYDKIETNLQKEHVVIHFPKAYLWVGCIDISFFISCLLLMILYPNNTADFWIFFLFLAFALLGIFIVVETRIWKIEIFRHKEFFIYRTMFYKTYKIKYQECDYYKLGTNIVKLKTQTKTFYIDNKVTNLEFLLAMLSAYNIKRLDIQGS